MSNFNVAKFGGKLQHGMNLTIDGVTYTHRAAFDEDEQIDDFLDSLSQEDLFNLNGVRDLENGVLIFWWKYE